MAPTTSSSSYMHSRSSLEWRRCDGAGYGLAQTGMVDDGYGHSPSPQPSLPFPSHTPTLPPTLPTQSSLSTIPSLPPPPSLPVSMCWSAHGVSPGTLCQISSIRLSVNPHTDVNNTCQNLISRCLYSDSVYTGQTILNPQHVLQRPVTINPHPHPGASSVNIHVSRSCICRMPRPINI